jgi:hypothetical protein
VDLLRQFRARGPQRLLAWQALIDTIGTGTSIGILTLYLVGPAGFGLGTAGVLLAISGATGFLGTFVAGPLAQRVGARQYVLAGNLLRAGAVGALALSGHPAVIVVALLLISLSESGSYSIYQVILTDAVGEAGRAEVIGARRAIGNVGFMISGVPVGVVLAIGTDGAYKAGFALDAITFLVGALLVSRLPRRSAGPVPSTSPVPRSSAAWRDRRYLGLAIFSIASTMTLSLFEVGLPLWLTRATDAPRWTVALLVVLNTSLVALLQIRIARSADDLPHAERALMLAVAASSAGVALVAVAGAGLGPALAAIVLLCGAALLTFQEMLAAAAWWTVSFQAAPADRRTEYLATFDLGLPLVLGFGPMVFVLIVVVGWVGWLVYAVVSLLAAIGAIRLVRTLPPYQPEQGPESVPAGEHGVAAALSP